MHSPSVSIFDPVWKRPRGRFSSTGFGPGTSRSGLGIQDGAVRSLSARAELLALPRGCEAQTAAHDRGLNFLAEGERKESIGSGMEDAANSNRKERQISAYQPLLNEANTSEIKLFADLQRPRSAQADEVVMDRGTERAARGCDAV